MLKGKNMIYVVHAPTGVAHDLFAPKFMQQLRGENSVLKLACSHSCQDPPKMIYLAVVHGPEA